MDTVLGVSMAPTAVRMVLVEGENGDGATVDEDNFDVASDDDAATTSAAPTRWSRRSWEPRRVRPRAATS